MTLLFASSRGVQKLKSKEYRAAIRDLEKGSRRNKYGAKKTIVDGRTFDSKAEAMHYLVLKDRQRKGEIRDIELQPQFKFTIDGRPVLIRSEGYPNGRQASFKADFRYWDEKRQAIVVADKKSSATKTEAYKLRKALVECMWPGTVIEEV